jgi:hypothetical protein
VHDLAIVENRIMTTEEYTYLVGGGDTPVVNGMAIGTYLVESQKLSKPFPEWVPFTEA